jgi:hypothetical protein
MESSFNSLANAILNAPAPVVTVEDINIGQRLVQVTQSRAVN